MEALIGRTVEAKILSEALESDSPELIAILGRRRVGKTFLIRSTYRKQLLFELSGADDASMGEQLLNFSKAMGSALGLPMPIAAPRNWTEAFWTLQEFLAPIVKKKKAVVFFDEFPWLSSRKSGFLSAFGHFWNQWGSQQANLKVVICGSAASWMIKNVVNNKGGLHNRLTKKIRLLPFTLYETELFLKSKGVNLDRYQILTIYMAMGGIPHYLKEIKRGESAAQCIDRLFFAKDGSLANEFPNLYRSLFEHADRHISVVRELAGRPSGMTREEIITACGLQSGGSTTTLLQELVESGFISAYVPFGKNANESIYKLSDEYTLFYLKFVENSRAKGSGTWLKKSAMPTWRSWSGYAFEGICLKHVKNIKDALGISGVYTEESAWRHAPKTGKGAQIDLLLNRSDMVISICEMKFSSSEFVIDKAYATELREKLNIFKSESKTKKSLFLVMVNTYGLKSNINSIGLVQNEVTMDHLFIP
ncbi:ATPase [Pedobacter ginsengisoli]|uniref:ATPase n=1 Tax=Pedobacter ginsengisoli TaxID=363852 RepID=A0A2D1U9E5_9SPHI|nr:ATP-binding protein [Pedobacter ginsengisoli]ATP58211.1 ATPase [Pedobacter ginsengisoli]